MSSAQYREVKVEPAGSSVRVHVVVDNTSRQIWNPETFSLGWQFFDPETNLFISEGEWVSIQHEIAPGQRATFELSILLLPEPGGYQIYVSPIAQPGGWI